MQWTGTIGPGPGCPWTWRVPWQDPSLAVIETTVLLMPKRPMRWVSPPSSQAPGDRALAGQTVVEVLGNLMHQVLEWHLLMQQLLVTDLSQLPGAGWYIDISVILPCLENFWVPRISFSWASLVHSTSSRVCLIHFVIFIGIVLLNPRSRFPHVLNVVLSEEKKHVLPKWNDSHGRWLKICFGRKHFEEC